jgi:hypothetical protein
VRRAAVTKCVKYCRSCPVRAHSTARAEREPRGAAAQVRYREERTSFLHFLTSVCAIVGGVFTVSGILDAFVYHGAQAVRKKVDLGKQI